MADPGAEYDLKEPVLMGERALNSVPLRHRNRGPAERPQAGEENIVTVFASGLGNAIDIARHEKGGLFVLDADGRVIVLADREMDGQPDIQQVLEASFDRPSGIVVAGNELFISDQEAIWRLNLTGTEKQSFVSLKNVTAEAQPRPLAASPDGKTLRLGLNNADGTSRIVEIDLETGRASNFASGQGVVRAMAQQKGTPLWLAIDGAVASVTEGTYSSAHGQTMETGTSVTRVYLPAAQDDLPKGFENLSGQFLVMQGGQHRLAKTTSGGHNLVAVPASFGQPQDKMSVVIDGLIGDHGRSRWGEFSAVTWDARGLFILDKANGILWRAHAAPPKLRAAGEEPEKTVRLYEEDKVKKPKASWGSSITDATTINTGSKLAVTFKQDSIIPNETLMEKMKREKEEAKEKEKAEQE